jgi:hemoglobin-like flavoprotein
MRRHPVAASKALDHLAAIPIDHALIGRLEVSFRLLREQSADLGRVFYAKLFAAAPHLRPMFRTHPDEQAAKLVASLEMIVGNLAAPGANAAMLSELGRRHAGYGAKPEHYVVVVDLLVESMRDVLGARSDERVLDEWRTALRLVSRQMIAAGQTPSGPC